MLKAIHPSPKGSGKPVFGSWFRLPHLSSAAESGLSSFHKNWTLDDNIGLCRLKIGWDIAKVFLRYSCVTVLPLDLFSNGNHNVSSPFCHFFCFK
jgi:hypothetical protein